MLYDARSRDRFKPTERELGAAAKFQPYFASHRNSHYYLAKFKGTQQLDEIAGLLAELRTQIEEDDDLEGVSTGGVGVRKVEDGPFIYLEYYIAPTPDFDFYE